MTEEQEKIIETICFLIHQEDVWKAGQKNYFKQFTGKEGNDRKKEVVTIRKTDS